MGIKKHLSGKAGRKCALKASPWPIFYFFKNTANACKKLAHGQDYDKSEFELVISLSLGKMPIFITIHIWVIPKIKLANLCKQIYDVIRILVSHGPLNFETMGRGKIYKKSEYLENKKSFLKEILRIFQKFLNAFFW